MNLSEIFIKRPVMTCLVMVTILFFGILAYFSLPVSDLPSIEYPTIEVTTSYPGASPQVISDTITSPLERQFTTIEGIRTISSTSQTGSSSIVLQFNLDTTVESAAPDVQSAINQTLPNLPPNLPYNPVYQKVNPTQTPILWLALVTDSMTIGELYDYAYSFLGQRLGMVDGISQIETYGSPYAVRVQIDPDKVAAHNIGFDEIASVLSEGNPEIATGTLYGPKTEYTLDIDGQIPHAEGFNSLIVRNNNGSMVRIEDLGNALNSLNNDKYSLNYTTKDVHMPAIALGVKKQVGKNTLKIIDGINELLPSLQKELPASIQIIRLFDESSWINESVNDVLMTLLIAFLLVVLVVFFYLGKLIDTIIPVVALPLSIIGTFAMMFIYGFSIDILSLLAITLSVGFLVDDAIVVLENINRHVEMGESPLMAALKGSKQISFTILSMTLCLASVFIPMVFLAGIMGRIFREFAITIITAVLISGFVSLSLTPLLCSRFMGTHKKDAEKKNWIEKISNKLNTGLLNIYKKGLDKAVKHRFITLMTGFTCLLVTGAFFYYIPKDFLPPDDLGFIQCFALAEDGTSPYQMINYQKELTYALRDHPYVEDIMAIAGIPQDNQSLFFIRLVPYKDRKPILEAIREFQKVLYPITGVQVFMKPLPLINLDVGTQTAMGNYQYTLQSVGTSDLYEDAEKLIMQMRGNPTFTQVTSDMHITEPQVMINIERDRASDLNITASDIENTFSFAYSGGRVSTINGALNQYNVIVETLPNAYKDPSVLNRLYITSTPPPGEAPMQVPLSAITNWKESAGPLTINHLNTLPSVTITFDLHDVPLSTGLAELDALSEATLAPSIMGNVQGTADVFVATFKSLSFLFIITLFVIYIILGILYENFIHPLTVMSALPLATMGGLLTLIIFGQTLSLYSFVGLIMLLGIVLKNGIMMIDFANEAINEGKSITEAITWACHARFRPILMTTFAAMMGAVPIALGIGGLTALSRRSLGLAIVGGLIFSQILTLFVTPVIFIYLETLREKISSLKKSNTMVEDEKH